MSQRPNGSHARSAPLSRALVCLLLSGISGAYADVPVVMDEPVSAVQTGQYQLRVLEDGLAQLHLKWLEANGSKGTANLSLSTFKSDGQPTAIVGFAGVNEGTSSLLPDLQNVEISAAGTQLQLGTSGLTSDLNYSGQLFATVGRETLIWGITLVRPSAVAPFGCPTTPVLVGAEGAISLDFPRSPVSLASETIGLRLSDFISKELELGQVGFVAAGSPELQRELLNQPLEANRFVPALRAVGLTEGSVYTGRVWFVLDGRDLMECTITLQMPKLSRGELVSDIPSITRNITMPVGGGGQTSMAVHLTDKTRMRRVDGITVVLVGPTLGPEGTFDLEQHVSISLNGTPIPSITQLQLPIADADTRAARTLQPGEQMNVGITVDDLHAGKYTFALGFAGVNSATTPRLDVAINVRHHWFWAVLAVLFALATSFFVGKGIVNWRERIRIRGRIQQMRGERFDAHAALPSVVFLRAVLAQTEKLIARQRLLAPPPSVYDYLARAERVVAILRRYSAVQEAVADAPCSESIKDRYRQGIADVLRRIGPQPLDQKTADGVVEDLGAIAATLSDPSAWYWSTLKNDAKRLAEQAESVVDKLGDSELVKQLLATLGDPPAAPNGEFPKAYWLVKLLYSRRKYPDDIDKVIAAYSLHKSLDDAIKVANERAWQRLCAAVDAKRITIKAVDNLESQETLRPTKFALKFEDALLAESYLVQNVLEYEWCFKLTVAPKRFARKPEQPSERKSEPPTEWTVVVNGPRITQYARSPGHLEVGVKIRWRDTGGAQVKEVGSLRVDVNHNTELSLLNHLDRSELLLMGIVTAMALGTSLPSLYFAKETFGAFADYMAILAWAVGIDQGKNLIQLMKAHPADAPAAG